MACSRNKELSVTEMVGTGGEVNDLQGYRGK